MSQNFFISKCQTFCWQDQWYLLLFTEKTSTEKERCWVYLSPIFKRSTRKLVKKYPYFSFQTRKQFGRFSFPNFSRISSEALFLCFEEFQQLAILENKQLLLLYFQEQLYAGTTAPDNVKPILLEKPSMGSFTIPSPGYIYIAKFPSLQLGKVGITENWKNRLNQLQKEYSEDGEMVFWKETKNPRKAEMHILDWLRKENYDSEYRTKKGSISRETFSLNKISEKKVQEYLLNYLVNEQDFLLAPNLIGQQVNHVLVKKLENDRDFALKYYVSVKMEMKRIEIQEAYNALSPEVREKMALKMLLQSSSLPFENMDF